MRQDVRSADASDVPEVVRTLVRAFADDPLHVLCAPDRSVRAAWLAALYGRRITGGIARGEVMTIGRPGVAAAHWGRTDRPTTAWSDRLVLGGRLTFTRGLRATPVLAVSRALAAGRPRAPHVWLQALGTTPEERGRGLASALVSAGLEKADRCRLPAYLEVLSESLIEFYGRWGFAVCREVVVDVRNERVHAWCMSRRLRWTDGPG